VLALFLASYFKQKVINFKQLNTVARWLVNALRLCSSNTVPSTSLWPAHGVGPIHSGCTHLNGWGCTEEVAPV